MTEEAFDTPSQSSPLASEIVIPTPPRRGWWHNAALAGLAVSFFAHTALLLILTLMMLDRGRAGDAGEGEEIQFAVMDDSELTDLLESSIGAEQPVIEENSVAPVFEFEDLHSPLADVGTTAVDESLLAALQNAGAGDMQEGGASDGLFSTGGSAKFFGIEAQGSRFAYIVDVSGSMDGARAQALKVALMASIEALSDESRFSIVLFSDRATALTGEGWIKSGDAARATARQRINAINVGGGTNPVPAFDIIRTLRPMPDAIYLMTDGEFLPEVEEAVLVAVTQMVRGSDGPMPIHALTFVSRGAEPLMRRIARMTRGSYTHVEGPR